MFRKIPGNSAVAGLRFPALQSRGGDGSLFAVLCRDGFRDFLRPDFVGNATVPVFSAKPAAA